MKKKKQKNKGAQITRRQMLKGSVGVGITAGSALLGFPLVYAKDEIVLRYAASGVTAYQQIAEKAKQDLGITLKMERAATIQANMLRVITRPKILDVLDFDYGHIRSLSQMGMLKVIETNKLKYFDQLTPIFTTGSLAGRKLSRQGGAPFLNCFLESSKGARFTDKPSEWMALVPTVFNADTLGIKPDLIKRPIKHWHELLNPEYKGKTSIMNILSIGILDVAMAIESMGKFTYKDKGNMTRAEIDKTIGILIGAKKQGQFTALWNDFMESVELMASGKVVIQSMWSPAVTKIRQMGISCYYQPLEEGYRGWCYGIGLSRALTGKKLDAAYEFINWYQSGWVGAFMNRQGYYSSVPQTAKKIMDPYEWGYWMEGKPAANDIKSPEGDIIEKKDTVRDGGSFNERMSRIACWNSLMNESRYLLSQWQKFLDA